MTASDSPAPSRSLLAHARRVPAEVAPHRGAVLPLAVAAVAWAIWVAWGDAALPAVVVLAAAGAASGVIDARTHRLPNAITYPATAAVAVLLALAALVTRDEDAFLRCAVGAFGLGLFYLLLHLVNPGGLGLGDVKLAPMLGAVAAWFGWGTLVAAAVLPFVIGGLVAVVLMALRRVGRKSAIALGPYMLAGTAVALTLARLTG